MFRDSLECTIHTLVLIVINIVTNFIIKSIKYYYQKIIKKKFEDKKFTQEQWAIASKVFLNLSSKTISISL